MGRAAGPPQKPTLCSAISIMPDVIVDIDQIEPVWLTRVLRERGVLAHGQVVAIRKQAIRANTATAVRLEIDYSGDASPAPPRRLLVKLGRRRIEVEFYRRHGDRYWS